MIQEMACSIDGTTDGINHVMMCARDSNLPCSSVLRTVIRDRQSRPVGGRIVRSNSTSYAYKLNTSKKYKDRCLVSVHTSIV